MICVKLFKQIIILYNCNMTEETDDIRLLNNKRVNEFYTKRYTYSYLKIDKV